MASSTYDRRWQEAMSELNEQVHIEDNTLDGDAAEGGAEPPPQASIVEAFQHYACLYIKYLQILKRLQECYEQMIHPQKRIDVKQVMEIVMARIVELKHDMVKWNPPNPDVRTEPERSFPWEYVCLDDILVDLKLPPDSIEIAVPSCFIEENEEALTHRDRLVKGYMKLKHGVETIYLDENEEQLTVSESLTLDEAIQIIQRNERGRQGRQRGILVQELREEEKQRKLYDASQAPEMDADIAAANIQRMFRGYLSRTLAHRERENELVFIGMKPTFSKERVALAKQLDEVKIKRKTEQQENKEEYIRALVDVHGIVTSEEGPFMKEKMLEERRNWITKVMAEGNLPEDLVGYYASLGLNPDGTRLVTPEEEAAAAEAAAKEADAKKADAKTKGSKDARQKKDPKQKGGDKKKQPPPEQEDEAPEKPPPLTGPSELCRKLFHGVDLYEKIWLNRDELENFYQKYDVALAKDVVRGPVETEIRKQVDEMLLLQLSNIKAQLEAAAAASGKKKKGKKGGGKKKKKTGGGKKGKKGKKDKKSKKGKALPGDKIAELKGKAPDVFLNILIEHKMVHVPKWQDINEFIGSFNYLGTAMATSDRRDRFGNWIAPDPSPLQIRQNLMEYVLFPLGSPFVKTKTPPVRSVLLYGPKGSGKTMLVHALASQSGAMVLNLSPWNLLGKFPGKQGPTKLVHMVFMLAKASAMQPVIVYIDECEQIFAGGASGGGKKKKKHDASSAEGPARFKKDLLTYIKALEQMDRVVVIGTSSDPSAAEVKDLRNFFDKFLFIPYPDYASRVLLWKHAIARVITRHAEELGMKHVPNTFRDELDLSTLAHISEGYSSGSIIRAVNNTMTARRVECLWKRPLQEEEFLGALSRQTATFAEDNDKLRAFTAVVTGLKETREKIRKAAEEAANPEGDGKKDKKGAGAKKKK